MNSLIKQLNNENVDLNNSYKKNKSSAIFPIFISPKVNNFLTFFSYWKDRHKLNVIMELTLRKSSGQIESVKEFNITKSSVEKISINKVFNLKSRLSKRGFFYSLEIEIFSENKPKIPIPAISIMYQCHNDQSIVHAATRIIDKNEETDDILFKLPQTGFEVFKLKKITNYIIFIGGYQKKYTLKLDLMHDEKRLINKKIILHQNHPKQLHLVKLDDLFNLKKNVKVSIKVKKCDVFPRFFAGNFLSKSIPTVTHTFTDNSIVQQRKNKIAFKKTHLSNFSSNKYYDTVFMIPVINSKNIKTELSSYSNNYLHNSHLIIELFDSKNNLIDKQTNDLWLKKMKMSSCINLTNWCAKNFNLKDDFLFIKFAIFSKDGFFHKRHKFGLNIYKNRHMEKGCNICFGPSSLYEDKVKHQKFSTKWGPVGGKENFIFTIHNVSFNKIQESSKNIFEISFYNSFNEKFIKTIKLKPNDSFLISVDKDTELKKFLRNELGYIYVKSDTWCQDSFFFSLKGNYIAGDHSF